MDEQYKAQEEIKDEQLSASGESSTSGQAVTAGGCLWNLAAVTIGNMIGGIVFVALPYFAASRQK